MTYLSWMATGLLSFTLTGCAMQPLPLREALDTCTQYQFETLVYRRQFDGAVTRVLCVPGEGEVDRQVEYRLPLGWLLPFRG